MTKQATEYKCFGLTTSLLILAFVHLTSGCEQPAPVKVIAFMDASASSVKLRPRMKTFIEDFVHRLDRHLDKLVVYRLASTTGVIYDGEAFNGPGLRKSLEDYLNEPPSKGTSYGLALDQAVKDAAGARLESRIPVILMVGDAEDEPGPGCVNMTPDLISNDVKKLPDNALLAFTYATPSDRFSKTFQVFQNAMGPSHDSRLQFSTPDTEDNHAVRRFLVTQLKR